MTTEQRASEFMDRWFGLLWRNDLDKLNIWSALMCLIDAAVFDSVKDEVDEVPEYLEGWPCSAGFAPRDKR